MNKKYTVNNFIVYIEKILLIYLVKCQLLNYLKHPQTQPFLIKYCQLLFFFLFFYVTFYILYEQKLLSYCLVSS